MFTPGVLVTVNKDGSLLVRIIASCGIISQVSSEGVQRGIELRGDKSTGFPEINTATKGTKKSDRDRNRLSATNK